MKKSFSDGSYPNGGKKEGIVIRPTSPIYSTAIGAELSMKVVSNKHQKLDKDNFEKELEVMWRMTLLEVSRK